MQMQSRFQHRQNCKAQTQRPNGLSALQSNPSNLPTGTTLNPCFVTLQVVPDGKFQTQHRMFRFELAWHAFVEDVRTLPP